MENVGARKFLLQGHPTISVGRRDSAASKEIARKVIIALGQSDGSFERELETVHTALQHPPDGVRREEVMAEQAILLVLRDAFSKGLDLARAIDQRLADLRFIHSQKGSSTEREALSASQRRALALERLALQEVKAQKYPTPGLQLKPNVSELSRLLAGAPPVALPPPARDGGLGENVRAVSVPNVLPTLLGGWPALENRISELRGVLSDASQPTPRRMEAHAEFIVLDAAQYGLHSAADQLHRLHEALEDAHGPKREVFQGAATALDSVLQGLLKLNERFLELAASARPGTWSVEDVEMQVLAAFLWGYPEIQKEMDQTEGDDKVKTSSYRILLQWLYNHGPQGITRTANHPSSSGSGPNFSKLRAVASQRILDAFSAAFPDIGPPSSRTLGWEPSEQ